MRGWMLLSRFNGMLASLIRMPGKMWQSPPRTRTDPCFQNLTDAVAYLAGRRVSPTQLGQGMKPGGAIGSILCVPLHPHRSHACLKLLLLHTAHPRSIRLCQLERTSKNLINWQGTRLGIHRVHPVQQCFQLHTWAFRRRRQRKTRRDSAAADSATADTSAQML